MTIPDINKLKGPQFTEKHFKFHYPEFLEYLNNNYPKELTFQEKIYWYYNNLTEFPKCKTCGKKVKFINTRTGYQVFCSKKCSNSNPDVINKTKQTCLEKFGGVAPGCSEKIQEKMRKTNKLRYGVENAMQNEAIANKTKQTNIERYGGCGNASKTLKDKFHKTCLERYGVENVMQNPDIVNNIRKKTLQTHDFLIGYTPEGDWICKCPHPECNKCTEKYYIIPSNIYSGRKSFNTEPCTKLLSIGSDNTKNTSIELFIRNILDKYNIEYETNVRDIISPKELDIYIPAKKLAIECNGIFSHCDRFKRPSYHINKTKMCRELDVQLLHVWEDWIKDPIKSNIVTSLIKNKIGIEQDITIIYARKCTIEQCMNKKEYLGFLDNNHIQGRSGFKVGYGLRYNGELVSVMTFGSKRVCMGNKDINKNEWELLRFCNKLNHRIPGGASKLLKHFITDIQPEYLISFSSNDISDGNLYKQLGFEVTDNVSSSYWYVDPKTFKRYHRFKFRKSELVKMGFDKKKSEREIMKELDYLRIYDSGQLKWILKK